MCKIGFRHIEPLTTSCTSFPTKTRVGNSFRLLTTSRKHSRHVFGQRRSTICVSQHSERFISCWWVMEEEGSTARSIQLVASSTQDHFLSVKPKNVSKVVFRSCEWRETVSQPSFSRKRGATSREKLNKVQYIAIIQFCTLRTPTWLHNKLDVTWMHS